MKKEIKVIIILVIIVTLLLILSIVFTSKKEIQNNINNIDINSIDTQGLFMKAKPSNRTK